MYIKCSIRVRNTLKKILETNGEKTLKLGIRVIIDFAFSDRVAGVRLLIYFPITRAHSLEIKLYEYFVLFFIENNINNSYNNDMMCRYRLLRGLSYVNYAKT